MTHFLLNEGSVELFLAEQSAMGTSSYLHVNKHRTYLIINTCLLMRLYYYSLFVGGFNATQVLTVDVTKVTACQLYAHNIAF